MPISTDLQSLMVIDTEFEKILTNPILDIAARFWDEERYDVFKVCYRSMREIDDLIDHRKSSGDQITYEERIQFDRAIQQWAKDIADNANLFPFQKMIARFQLPIWPWERLGRAMIYDIGHDGFSSLRTFLRYAEGAAISPASVFVHLCGVKKENEAYVKPGYDIRTAARPLAIFSYLVHILRDFEKDQNSRLNYFADDILTELKIDKKELKSFASEKQIEPRLVQLFNRYKTIAGFYRRKAAETFEWLLPQLEPRYQLSLKIIFALYSQIFEEFEPDKGRIFSDSAPTPAQIQERIDRTVSSFMPVN